MKPHILRFALVALTTGMMAGSALAAPEAVPARAPAKPSLSSPQLLLQMFLAEVALARGMLADADALYGELLKRSDDERIVRRGNDIALANVMRYLQAAPAEAEKRLQERLRIAGGRPTLLLQLPALYGRHPDKQASLDAVLRLTRPYLREPEAQLARALAQQQAGNLSQAMLDSEAALKLRPDWEVAMMLRLRMAPPELRDQMLDELQAFVRRNPAALDARLTQIRWLLEAQRPREAREAYLGLLVDQRGNVDVALSVASLAARNGDFLTARSVLKELVAQEAGETDRLRLLLGQVNEELGLIDEAMASYRTVAIGEHFAAAQGRLAALLAGQGRQDEALTGLRAAALQPGAAVGALQLQEAALLREAGQREQAFRVIERVLQREPDNETALYDGALLAEQLGQPALMETRLRHLLRLQPEHTHALNALGYSFADRNVNLDEAQQLLERAIALEPEDPAIIDSLGWLRYRQGRLPEALVLLQRAYASFPDPEVAAHLSEVLWHAGQQEAARTLWQQMLAQHPGNPLLLDLARRLGF